MRPRSSSIVPEQHPDRQDGRIPRKRGKKNSLPPPFFPTVDDLTALGLNLDQTIASPGKADDILSTANCGIYRQRHANTAAAPRAAAPRGAPVAP